MRIANTLRITAHTKNSAQQQELIHTLKTYVKTPVETQTLTHETYPTIYKTKLWLTKQQEIRAILRLVATLPQKDKQTILDEIPQRTDERGNLYFRLDKQEFLNGRARLKNTGDVLQLRINIAAHPKNAETITERITTFLTAPDIKL